MPKIHKVTTVATSVHFKIEEIKLEFSNGETRDFERLCPTRRSSVMIVPVLDAERFLLIREYGVGIEQYSLGFPKGGVAHVEESALATAQRELQEETQYGAKSLVSLGYLTTSPSYSSHKMELFVAQDLYHAPLIGDEPEPIEVIPWRWDQLDLLLNDTEFTEARTIAALFKVQRYMTGKS